jgi:hypothetical protein
MRVDFWLKKPQKGFPWLRGHTKAAKSLEIRVNMIQVLYNAPTVSISLRRCSCLVHRRCLLASRVEQLDSQVDVDQGVVVATIERIGMQVTANATNAAAGRFCLLASPAW